MGDVVNVSWGDILKTEGILHKGYGILPKYAMLDRGLSLVAKSIYAYLCSLAGDGCTTFPSRDTILGHLQINKETYYKHFKQLTDGKYVSVRKDNSSDGRFAHNVYRLESNPKKFAEEANVEGGSVLYSTLSCQGIKAAGYGSIPRVVMYDNRLSIKAKGIYAYFASYSGAGKVAFPKLKNLLYHLGISCNTYYSYLNELTALNYIVISQRHVDGKLGVNDYYLVDKPDEVASSSPQEFLKKKHVIFTVAKEASPQVPKKPDMDESLAPEALSQLLQKPDTDESLAPEAFAQLHKKQDTGEQDTAMQSMENQAADKQPTAKQDMLKQDTETPDATINSSSINSSSNIKSIYLPQQPQAGPLSREVSTAHWIDMMDRAEQREYIKCSLGYDDFALTGIPSSMEQVNNLIEIVLSTLRDKKAFIRVAGQDIERGEVVDQLLSLDYEHYEYVLDAVEKTQTHIKNIKAYYLTALYNAPSTYEAYIMREVQEDFSRELSAY